ncbi:MAG: BamA/TamA family outer membrane protein [Fodinibius sp.]|nr:BamA/TamA family outer membrane protein [Fodinibius sp.]
MMIRYLLLFVIAFCFTVTPLRAQMGGPVGADSVSNAIVPVVSYSSIEGLVGGGLYNRYDYRGNVQPFRNYLQSSALVSTKGFIEVEAARYDSSSVHSADASVQFMISLCGATTPIFSLGSVTTPTFRRAAGKMIITISQLVAAGASYKARYPLYSDDPQQLDLMGGAGVEYHIPYSRGNNSSFARQMPNGSDGGWVNYLNTGLIWENRNSEFDPQKGNYAELEFRYSPDFISDFALGTARLELRQYFQLFNFLTVANRLEARHVTGDVPYWERSTLGGNNNLRGYPLNRFQGTSSLVYSLELRAWVLKFPEFLGLKFGGITLY